MDDLTREFIAESRENLDQLERDLLVLEKDPGSRRTLSSIFRTIHTLKGTCGFLAFEKLETIAHAAEGLLSLLRNGEIAMSADIATAVLATSDFIRHMLTQIEATGEEGDCDGSAVVGMLTGLQSELPLTTVAPELPLPAPETAMAETTVRVNVTLLDQLMNMVGELVLTRNQIAQTVAREENAALAGVAQRLNLITSVLQERVMKTRMEPIGNVWQKFPRLVRDLEQTCGKQVRLVCTGECTELDRTLLQAIRDPLTHLVRNAVDHGIELPKDRQAAGKPPAGLLTLRAYHEGGLVNIEMMDDGAGIDPARVRQHAVQRGLLTEAQSARLSNREAVELIFLPGFSTAEKVSNVSGRGVGMDVVKTHIEKIGGVVDVLTKTGRGTTFKIRIPLTLAIIPALTVSCGGERYAIPQVNVTELLSIKRDGGVEHLQGALVHRLRGSLLPILHLAGELQIPPAQAEPEQVQVVVVQAGERRFGLIVDEVHDAGEIVVKPLGKLLKGTPCLAGATIMGDGSVALIVDVFSLARRAELIAAEAHSRAAAHPALLPLEAPGEELLLFGLGERRLAIRVAAVARLEEFPRHAIESSGGRSAVQYRGAILPLFGATGSLPEALAQAPGDHVCAIVYTEQGRSAGLVVSSIDDIVRHAPALQRGSQQRGLLGSAIIDAHLIDVIDAGAMVRAEDPTFYGEAIA